MVDRGTKPPSGSSQMFEQIKSTLDTHERFYSSTFAEYQCSCGKVCNTTEDWKNHLATEISNAIESMNEEF